MYGRSWPKAFSLTYLLLCSVTRDLSGQNSTLHQLILDDTLSKFSSINPKDIVRFGLRRLTAI